MRPEFNPCDDATWPLVLTVVEVAAIVRRTPAAVKKACAQRRFVPAPFEIPYRWRKADVLRHVVSGRGALRSAS